MVVKTTIVPIPCGRTDAKDVCVSITAIPRGAMATVVIIMIHTLRSMERIHGVIPMWKTGNATRFLDPIIVIAGGIGSVFKDCIANAMFMVILLTCATPARHKFFFVVLYWNGELILIKTLFTLGRLTFSCRCRCRSVVFVFVCPTTSSRRRMTVLPRISIPQRRFLRRRPATGRAWRHDGSKRSVTLIDYATYSISL